MRPRLRRLLVGALITSLVIPALGILEASPAPAAGFAAGNIVVARVGTGDAALSGASTPVFLDEYTPAGTLVQSVPLPTAGAGANKRLTMSGSATSEGALALSSDGRYVTLTGYDADPGTASVAGSSTGTVSRVVARVDGNGAVDTSTAITDVFSGSNVRGAVSDDGSRFWVVGASGGVRLAALGGAGSTAQINSAAPTNLRVAGIAGGQLSVSTGSAPTGVYAVGSGLPTTGGQTPALTAAAPSPYGFVALDSDPAVSGVDTLYVADDSASPNGGILKFSFDGAAWTARGSFRPAGGGARGLTGSITPSGVTLFATTTTNALVKVDDTAAYNAPISATAVTLRTAAANTALRGVAFAPAGGSVVAPTITTQPQDATVASGGTATLDVVASGTGPLNYQWYQGIAGDTANPVGTGQSFTTPPLTATTSYWVRVSGPGGQVDSRTAVVTVGAATPCTATPVSIGSVQGTTDVSPVAGQTVTVRGTIVADYEGAQPALRGFYVQDAGDGNSSTSDGIFVFDNGANLVSNGDVVQVTGPVSEFQGQTQITVTSTGVESCDQQATVAPTDVDLPRASIGDLEPYEGMLVRFHQTLTVSEHFQLGRFGQVVVSSGGRLRQPTADIRATDQAAVQALQNANNLNRLIIDDGNQAQNPDPIVFGRGGTPLSASNTLRGGDTVTDPVGVLSYTWAGNAASGNAYRLRPVGSLGGTAVFDAVNERPAAPPVVGGGVKVASANLLNFFNTFTGCRFGTIGGPADCRGADNSTEYERQLAKEVASLRFLGADVVGYMEMENDGYGSSSAVQALVDALNAAEGAGTWAFIDADAATGVVDVAGTDAIKAGLLYRTASVQPVAGATFVDQNPVFERRPVAQTFQTPAGARFTVIANHFKSKGSCPASGPDADQGDGQSCWNARRTEQAGELAGWIAGTVVPGAGDPDVLIVGDLNSYAGEDPIASLEAAGFVNQVKAFHGLDAYSYVFDGQWGYLDYVLTSASMTGQVTGAGDAHHNADEPTVLDYNTEFKTPGQVQSLYAPDRFRTSDHDPVLVGLDLGVAPQISGTPPPATVGAPYSFGFTVSGGATVSLAAGALPPGLVLGSAGTISGTPTGAGEFSFVVRASNAFGSAEHAATISVAKATTTTVLTSSANPATVDGAVRFTATVSGAPTGGTVQFTVDGQALGGPVPVVNGVATSDPVSTLSLGTHAVTASYSGNDSYLPSNASLSQVVWLGVRVLSPTAGSTVKAGSVVPIRFQLTDAAGRPIPHLAAVLLLVNGRIKVSASGAQTLAPTTPLYNPFDGSFVLPWPTAKKRPGQVTVTITVTYPNAPTQQVPIPITLN